MKINTDSTTLSILVKDTSNYNYKFLEESKPDYVDYISMSSDPEKQANKILIKCSDAYKKLEIKKWLKTGYSKIPFDYQH